MIRGINYYLSGSIEVEIRTVRCHIARQEEITILINSRQSVYITTCARNDLSFWCISANHLPSSQACCSEVDGINIKITSRARCFTDKVFIAQQISRSFISAMSELHTIGTIGNIDIFNDFRGTCREVLAGVFSQVFTIRQYP